MTEKPFVHKVAFYDVKNSFMYHEEVAKILLKLLNVKGILNVGGKIQSVYNFAKIGNPKVKKIFLKKNKKMNMPINPSINTKKMKKILKNN
jgi:dTDP-4-dehydrorhamnose reductase